MSAPKYYYLALDVEATGQSLRDHDMVCFGAALVDVAQQLVVETFFTHVKMRPGTGWEPRCVDEFWSLPQNKPWYDEIAAAQQTAPSRAQAREAFLAWVDKAAALKDVTVLVDTASFDGAWLDQFLEDRSLLYLLGGSYKTVRDVSSWLAGVAWMEPCVSLNGTTKQAAAKLGVPVPEWPEWPHSHRPDSDAADIALTCAYFSNALARIKGTEDDPRVRSGSYQALRAQRPLTEVERSTLVAKLQCLQGEEDQESIVRAERIREILSGE